MQTKRISSIRRGIELPLMSYASATLFSGILFLDGGATLACLTPAAIIKIMRTPNITIQ
jgi:hypothetical protein